MCRLLRFIKFCVCLFISIQLIRMVIKRTNVKIINNFPRLAAGKVIESEPIDSSRVWLIKTLRRHAHTLDLTMHEPSEDSVPAIFVFLVCQKNFRGFCIPFCQQAVHLKKLVTY
jgi:hypothetical protein